jgi:hypothetical protein
MTHPIENKEPRPILIAHFSRKLATSAAFSIRSNRRNSERSPLRETTRGKSPRRLSEARSVPAATRRIRPHHGITRLRILGKGLAVLQLPDPSRPCISRRLAALKSFGSKLLPSRSNGVPGSSSLPQLRPVGWRSLARAQSVAPSCWSQVRSGSTSQSSCRRMPRAPSPTNPAELDWSGSSGLINLLVHHLAASAVSRCPSLLDQGPLRASIDQIVSYFVQRPSVTRRRKDRAKLR